ncbi:hypothetical protein OSTOST_21598 [Ostertagia ostertagi]
MRQLLLSSILWVTSFAVIKPDLYVWLEQNSYICDLSLSGDAPRFLTADESKQFKCECGDPLVSRRACSRRGDDLPICTEIPDLCMREYIILFTETSDRLSQCPPQLPRKHPRRLRRPRTTRRQTPTFRQLQQRQNTPPTGTRRPSNRQFLFRSRTPARPLTRRPSTKQNTFTLQVQRLLSKSNSQNRFPFTRRPSNRSRDRARPLPRLLPSSRFRSTFREQFPQFRRRPSTDSFQTTSNIMEAIKLSKTELLLAELTSRIRALDNKEPEHPLMDLREFSWPEDDFKENPIRAPSLQQHMPTVVDEEMKFEPETKTDPKMIPDAENSRRWGTVKSVPLPESAMSSSNLQDSDDSEGNDDGSVKEEMDEGKKQRPESVDNKEKPGLERVQPPIFNDPIVTVKPVEQRVGPIVEVKAELFAAESTTPPTTTSTTTVPVKQESPRPKESTVTLRSHEEAIEYLKSKIEALEKRLLDRMDQNVLMPKKNHRQENDFIASDDEVENVRRQSRLDSRRRIATAEHDHTADVLSNLDDLTSSEQNQDGPVESQDGSMARSVRMVRHSPPEQPSIVWTDVETGFSLETSTPTRRRRRLFR